MRSRFPFRRSIAKICKHSVERHKHGWTRSDLNETSRREKGRDPRRGVHPYRTCAVHRVGHPSRRSVVTFPQVRSAVFCSFGFIGFHWASVIHLLSRRRLVCRIKYTRCVCMVVLWAWFWFFLSLWCMISMSWCSWRCLNSWSFSWPIFSVCRINVHERGISTYSLAEMWFITLFWTCFNNLNILLRKLI